MIEKKRNSIIDEMYFISKSFVKHYEAEREHKVNVATLDKAINEDANR